MATRALWYTHGIATWHRGWHVPAAVIVHQLCDEADATQFSGSPGAMLLKAAERRGQKVPPPPLQCQTLVKATCGEKATPLPWSGLVFYGRTWSLDLGTQRCHYPEASVLG